MWAVTWPPAGSAPGKRGRVVHGHVAATGVGAAPLGSDWSRSGALVLLAVLVVRGSRDLWPWRRAEPWTLPLIAGALLIFVLGPLRLVASDGAELSGRASTFVYIPVAVVAAMALRRPRRSGPALRDGAARVAAAAVLVMGGIATGGRLPGIGCPGRIWPPGSSGQWTHRESRRPDGPSVRSALGTGGPRTLPGTACWPRSATRIRCAALRCCTTAKGPIPRLATWSPTRTSSSSRWICGTACSFQPAAAYFPYDPNAGRYRAPLPRSHLKAISRVAGVSRIYDSGDIQLYDLRGSAYDR